MRNPKEGPRGGRVPSPPHRELSPEQYAHPLCGLRVRVEDTTDRTGQPIEGIVLRVVPSSFGPLAILAEYGETAAWPASGCTPVDRYTLNGVETTLEEFLGANDELDPEDRDAVQALQPGEEIRFGGGAAPLSILRRELPGWPGPPRVEQPRPAPRRSHTHSPSTQDPMNANANDTVDAYDLPTGGELHRTAGGFWFAGDGTGAFVRLSDADIREMYRLSCATVLFEAPMNTSGDLIRVERQDETAYRILTSSPSLSPEWFRVETRPSWSSARAFVSRHTNGYACPDLAEPTGETLAEWRERTGEHGGRA
jgi:hypothetical protein